MSKPNKTGRNANKKGTYIHLELMMEPAWTALTPKAQILYIWLRMEFKGNRYNNNGKIRFSYRQAARRIGISINTAAEAFKELQRKGFIVVTQLGSLGVEGDSRGPCYELTDLPVTGPNAHSPQRLYRRWTSKCEFNVARHNVNNPNGRRLRATSHLKN